MTQNDSAGSSTALEKTAALVAELNRSDIRYCHWKSNHAVASALAGGTDLDLLVDRSQATNFRSLLSSMGFRTAIEAGVKPLPAVEHFHAIDEATSEIAHVHAYYRVVSGESLAKNYRLPVEEMLLSNTRFVQQIAVPSPEAELVLFVVRMLIKHTSPVELAFLVRDRRSFEEEKEWLQDASLSGAIDLVADWLPEIDRELFTRGYEALFTGSSVVARVLAGQRMKSRLRGRARMHPVRAQLVGAGKFGRLAAHRMRGSSKKLTPGGGGTVIAFVGAEATGKSTVISEVASWLGGHFTVRLIHAGKPPPTALSFVPHRLLPQLRRWFPEHRSTRIATRHRAEPDAPGEISPIHAIRSVMLGHDRRALLQESFARAANGSIILCDRYPSVRPGTIDGPQLTHLPSSEGRLVRALVRKEAELYATIPVPDLVIRLRAPLDVTLARNAARAKTEDPDFVRERHAMSEELDFGEVPVHVVDTDRPLADVIDDVKQVIWNAL